VASIFGAPQAAGPFGATPQVVLTGGVRTPSDALVGPIADIAIRSLHVDLLFLGCHGIDPVAGLTTPNLAEAETNRAFVQAARRVTVVADHTKWGIVGLSSFAGLDEVDTFITDALLHEEARTLLRERVGELVLADAQPDGQVG
jgi:DeoR/GlpR family transcriptional regulator of sugar metabolism